MRRPNFIPTLQLERLEIKDLSLCSEINHGTACIHRHIGVKFFLVNLTSIGAGNSDPDGDFILDEIR
jgi:hypothetical protein